ncbi:bacterial bifunctional deaminase-reductase [Pholiota conissans]|uniref:2,5-diamino-6-ribosylamino-4(3H)-pyrimidinone 5'-phosphate reductase n=1 Tax=Pholiota conissans TaxID=109636 RepID=A0A9P6D8D5_9AGAR|nr:bacterial bifunctional deaminase-reductase [Pholiota conissans]
MSVPIPDAVSATPKIIDNSNPPQFLIDALKHHGSPPPETRPHVTLTFAQSLDAKIAGARGRQLILSGTESMRMTHWMRTLHDAILVGVRTAINDDPQLNVRHLPPPPPNAPPHALPRPIIVDTHLRLPLTCKLLRNFQAHTGRRPWVLCIPHSTSDIAFADRRRALEAAGARVVDVKDPRTSDAEGMARVSAAALLQTLRELGVKSLMVEGGARIIGSFLAERDVVDALIITVAPVLVGEAGVGYDYPTTAAGDGALVPRFRAVHTEIVGNDAVVVLLPPAEP